MQVICLYTFIREDKAKRVKAILKVMLSKRELKSPCGETVVFFFTFNDLFQSRSANSVNTRAIHGPVQ